MDTPTPKPIDAFQKQAINILPINELKDVVIFFASGSAMLINKDANYFELGKKALDAIIGSDQIKAQFKDMSEEEREELKAAFKAEFNLTADDKDLELYIEKSFNNAMNQIYDTIRYLDAKGN